MDIKKQAVWEYLTQGFTYRHIAFYGLKQIFFDVMQQIYMCLQKGVSLFITENTRLNNLQLILFNTSIFDLPSSTFLYGKINALTQDVVWSSCDTSSKINVAKFYALTNPKIK